MNKIILFPAVAVLIILVVVQVLSYLFSKLAYRSGEASAESRKPYACGEDRYDHMAQPDYSSFFPFAFFFTIAHVATLILTTVPVETTKVIVMVSLYISSVAIGLYTLFRR